jgi:hypothetical protein
MTPHAISSIPRRYPAQSHTVRPDIDTRQLAGQSRRPRRPGCPLGESVGDERRHGRRSGHVERRRRRLSVRTADSGRLPADRAESRLPERGMGSDRGGAERDHRRGRKPRPRGGGGIRQRSRRRGDRAVATSGVGRPRRRASRARSAAKWRKLRQTRAACAGRGRRKSKQSVHQRSEAGGEFIHHGWGVGER